MSRGENSSMNGCLLSTVRILSVPIVDAPFRGSDGLRHHLDRAARTFGHAYAATLAVIEVEGETLAGAELDHRIVGTDAIAVVAFETVAARQAAAGLEQRIGLVEAA